MSQIEKYSFDTSFDSDPGAASVGPSLHTAEEVAAARAESRAEGEKAGHAAAAAEREAQVAATLATLAENLATLGAAQETASRHAADSALVLAAALVRKVLPHTAERNSLAEIEALLRETLEAIIDEPRVVIRVAESVLDNLQERIDGVAAESAFPGKLVLIADPGIGIGDCRLEWADGGAERGEAALWAQIDAALARADLAVGGTTDTHPDPAPASPPAAAAATIDDQPTTAQEAVQP